LRQNISEVLGVVEGGDATLLATFLALLLLFLVVVTTLLVLEIGVRDLVESSFVTFAILIIS